MNQPTRDPRAIIRRLRQERGFRSDRALATAAGIPQPTLARYLAGTTDSMSVAAFEALSVALEVTISELLGEVPTAPTGNWSALSRLMGQLTEPDQQVLIATAKALVEQKRR